ncbi:MAG: cyclic pyranopterin monophosphate synthase MoaC [Cetobacterium sp.]|uniref:cyclic pyranopterin monophosphate synthase MoaC n=1 Tax=unclassified Cetobacterium TaxID=2630983 RepID=UPI00163CD200|nr:cyclic pyranopterin monophosphate synthase MoaC [Cetobacterium sp. 2A]MBC2856135.1 cyclic pyranopterin monophosphate synthase MoaC [Cetobacterium sp. 2A]
MLTHFNKEGKAVMVDVTEKNETERVAVAVGKITTNIETLMVIKNGTASKGDVLGVARVAGIMAAKRTSDLIPMCHPLFITGADIAFEIDEESSSVLATARVKTFGKTGVEMEALTALNVALLTIYDMCKAMDKRMLISGIHLQTKTGGKSGDFKY